LPIYDYACSHCGTVTEVVHGIHDAAPRFCPACGTEGSLKKAFAPPAVHFKGSGWAKKDRGSSTTTKAAAKASASGDAGAPASTAPAASDGGPAASVPPAAGGE
jgi:putative FmdB family regulatory protein